MFYFPLTGLLYSFFRAPFGHSNARQYTFSSYLPFRLFFLPPRLSLFLPFIPSLSLRLRSRTMLVQSRLSIKGVVYESEKMKPRRSSGLRYSRGKQLEKNFLITSSAPLSVENQSKRKHLKIKRRVIRKSVSEMAEKARPRTASQATGVREPDHLVSR